MGVAAWRVRRIRPGNATRKALALFAVQLGLNLLWSFLFFGLQRIGLALAEIAILLVAIVVNTVAFWRIDRVAGFLFALYAAWVAYATLLTASLWLLNAG
jgi:benzodiazapine receptor